MKICLNQLGKRYNRQWVYQHLSHNIQQHSITAITGANGSGKSTLLQCIAGAVAPTTGHIHYYHNEQPIVPTQVYQHISYAAPYMELVLEFTLQEQVVFHQTFKPYYPQYTIEYIMDSVQLSTAKHKPIAQFSSGMQQRLKLALAFYSKSSLLLLDEPTSNLDAQGIALYQQLLATHRHGRTTVISSNDAAEYAYATNIIHIEQYK